MDTVLADLDSVFDEMYATGGRHSVPPEALLKASVLMALYSIRSERAFCERLNYDLLFTWFLDMRIDQPAFDASTFSKNRQRLLDHDVADEFFAAASLREGLDEMFTVARLGAPARSRATLTNTNCIESMISITRTATSRVKNWRDGNMKKRWIAAGMLEAE